MKQKQKSMKSKKLSLTKLKLKSFTTSLNRNETHDAKGGLGMSRDCNDIPHTDPRICGGWTAGPTCDNDQSSEC